MNFNNYEMQETGVSKQLREEKSRSRKISYPVNNEHEGTSRNETSSLQEAS